MRPSTNSYSYLIHKIDEFIRKYYLNKTVKGFLYLAASFFASYILVTTAEYFGNFSPAIRTILFYGFLLLNSLILIRWIFIPLVKFCRLGKVISHEQAAEIIGRHFAPVKDKLLNTLQLKKLADQDQAQKDLIEASIEQKIAEIRPVPFTSAIKIKENRKYLKFVLPPLAILIFIGATAPSILSESTERLLQHDRKFIKKAPFAFVILNDDLSALQGEDFELKVKMTGNEIPQDVYIEDGVNTFRLEKENIISFHYNFKNIQDSKEIRLVAGEFSSEPYLITVKKKPALLNFDAYLKYPAYLRKQNQEITNSGDLTVPEGTQINWKFRTGNATSLTVSTDGISKNITSSDNNIFHYTYRALKTTGFAVKPVNGEVSGTEEISLNVKVIQDLNPLIQVTEKQDSVNSKVIYFVGQVSDDYGFSDLKFNYRVVGAETSKKISRPVNFEKNTLQSNFLHVWTIDKAMANAGDQVEYYFEVTDNDGINGPKTTRSAIKTLKLPTEEETQKKIEQTSKSIQDKMQQAVRKAAQIEQDAKRLNRDLINKRNLSFEEKKQVEQLLNKQKELENLVNEIKKENKQNLTDRNELHQENEQLAEKQKQIEDLFNNVLDEKTRDLLKNIQKLLEENNKNLTQQELSKMQTDNKALHKELDRILELYKQLEFDQKLADAAEKLKKLAQKEEKLKEQTENNSSSSAELAKQQEELNKTFEDIQNDLDDLAKKNEELEKKNDYANPEKEQEQIDQALQDSKKNLQNKNNRKAADNQKKAADQMKQLSEKLEQMQQDNDQEENNVNMQSLREILDNLVKSSFEQERIMQELRSAPSNAPGYTKLTQSQKDVRDNLKMVQDSLYSLSKKVPQIESFINKELQQINQNIESAISSLAERRTPEANRYQQYAMTSINNLALMLSEIQEKMQQAMQNAQQGGKGKQKSLSQLSKMQEQLNQNMQKARQQMQQQGNKPGQQGVKGQMSEQIAKMAREQQLIRQALNEINRDLNKDGKGGLGNLEKLAKDMEQSETDLVHKKIQQETLVRQQEILTKLLEAEKADRERELDNQRESKQGQNFSPELKTVLEDFKKIKQNEVELLKTVPPSLNSFYKLKVGDYFRLLNTN